MPLKVFAQETEDGIAKLITDNVIACASPIKTFAPTDKQVDDAMKAFQTTEGISNPDQPDLYYMDSILVTTGWNKNEDVFDRLESWAARNTPEDKQLNFQHDEKDIIGHITGNYAVDFQGTAIAGTTEANNLPADFEIRTNSVLYRRWSDEERQARMEQMIADIQEDKWFVSMECLFTGFDYAVIDDKDEHSVIKRDEASAFLSKHLRAYGGTGTFEGRRIGRLLRNIVFSGHGMVLEPANPRSVVIQDQKVKNLVAHSLIPIREKSNMADEILAKQVETLAADLEASKRQNQELVAKLETLDTEAIAAVKQELLDTIEAQKTALAQLQAKFDELVLKVEKTEADLVTKTEEAVAATKKLEEASKQATLDKRTFALKQKGLSDEEVSAHMTKFAEASDEMFEDIVAMIADPKSDDDADAKKDDKKDDKKDKKENPFKKDKKDDADADDADASAKDALDDVNDDDADSGASKASEDDTDTSEKTRKSFGKWVGSNLTSTATLKEYADAK